MSSVFSVRDTFQAICSGPPPIKRHGQLCVRDLRGSSLVAADARSTRASIDSFFNQRRPISAQLHFSVNGVRKTSVAFVKHPNRKSSVICSNEPSLLATEIGRRRPINRISVGRIAPGCICIGRTCRDSGDIAVRVCAHHQISFKTAPNGFDRGHLGRYFCSPTRTALCRSTGCKNDFVFRDRRDFCFGTGNKDGKA